MDDDSILSRPAPAADHRLSYGEGPFRFGDLRLPAGPGPFPIAVTVHGGFWRSIQDLSYFGHLDAALAERGVATWNIEYNRVGHDAGGWPGTLLDTGAAADHLRRLAADYPLDLSRAIAVGHSAGGHLALWLSMRRRIAPGSPVFAASPLPFAGAVSIAGVSDLRQGFALQLGSGAVERFIGSAPDKTPERYAAASPAELLPAGVPQILVHGRLDEAVPVSMSEHYVAAAQAMSEAPELVAFDNAGHFEPVDPTTGPGAATLTAITRLAGRPA